MIILIIQGTDSTTSHRIAPGFSNCGNNVFVADSCENIPSDFFDLTFVDPSVNFEVKNKINSDIIMFYDCQDQPDYFKPDAAYYDLKDHVTAYAKMSWVDDDTRNDGIQNIGFPLPVYTSTRKIAQIDTYSSVDKDVFTPFMICSPTTRSEYEPVEGGEYAVDEVNNITCISYKDSDPWGEYINGPIYNQRIDWLLSLRKYDVSYVGGIHFGQKNNNLGLEFHKHLFGNVELLRYDPMSWIDNIKLLANCKIGLCPTGHGRISWRTFDIMASGAILFWTDIDKEKTMIMPKEYVLVKDGEQIGKTISSVKDFTELWKAAQSNKVALNISDEEIMSIFHKQYR